MSVYFELTSVHGLEREQLKNRQVPEVKELKNLEESSRSDQSILRI